MEKFIEVHENTVLGPKYTLINVNHIIFIEEYIDGVAIKVRDRAACITAVDSYKEIKKAMMSGASEEN